MGGLRDRRKRGRDDLNIFKQSLAFAARRGWITVSPFSVMTADDRPTRDAERPPAHEDAPCHPRPTAKAIKNQADW